MNCYAPNVFVLEIIFMQFRQSIVNSVIMWRDDSCLIFCFNGFFNKIEWFKETMTTPHTMKFPLLCKIIFRYLMYIAASWTQCKRCIKFCECEYHFCDDTLCWDLTCDVQHNINSFHTAGRGITLIIDIFLIIQTCFYFTGM